MTTKTKKTQKQASLIKSSEIKDFHLKALRYVDNAKNILKENAGKKGDYYSDSKYVKKACNTAWIGVLVALDGRMQEESINVSAKKDKADVVFYREYLDKKNKTMLKHFNSAYIALCLSCGYDGDLRVTTSSEGIKLALLIINWCK